MTGETNLWLFFFSTSHVKRAWDHSGRKKNTFLWQAGRQWRGRGGGKCASATFSFPNQLLGSLCLPNFFLPFYLVFCLFPHFRAWSYAVKKVYSLDKRFIKIKCPCNELFCTLEETSISTQVPTSLWMLISPQLASEHSGIDFKVSKKGNR